MRVSAWKGKEGSEVLLLDPAVSRRNTWGLPGRGGGRKGEQRQCLRERMNKEGTLPFLAPDPPSWPQTVLGTQADLSRDLLNG